MTRILLTRSHEGNGAWADDLTALGFESVSLDCLRHEPTDNAGTRRRLSTLWQQVEYMAFTSARGVEAAGMLLPTATLESSKPRIAAVGPATAEACHRLFGRCDLQSATPTSKGLAELLGYRLRPGERVAVALADRGRRDLEEVLEPAGFQVERVVVYSTLPAQVAAERLDLSTLGLDVIFIASPSAVEGLKALARWPQGWAAPIVAIGPTTAQAVLTQEVAGRGVLKEQVLKEGVLRQDSGCDEFWVSTADEPSLTGMLKAWKAIEHQRQAKRPGRGTDSMEKIDERRG